MHNQYKILVWFSLLSCSSLLMLKTVLLGALWKDEFKETGGDSSARQQIRRRALKLGQDWAVLWSKGKGTFVRERRVLVSLTQPSTDQHQQQPWTRGGKQLPFAQGLFHVENIARALQETKPLQSDKKSNRKPNRKPTILLFCAGWTCQRSAASLSFSGSKPETGVPSEGSSINSPAKWEYFYARHH